MNLWADFDNQHLSPEAARPGQRGRLTEQVTLSSWREWLLQDYVSSYCRSLAALRIYRRCYWIDAWGGREDSYIRANSSLKEHEVRPQKGRKDILQVPPILQSVVSLSATLAQESRPIALNGIVLEAGSSKRKVTRAAQNGNMSRGDNLSAAHIKERETLPKESGVMRASWLEVAPIVLKQIEQSPAIFLLNPFGHALFSYDDLALLYQRTTAPTELCLLISHKQAERRLLSSASTSPDSSVLTALLRTDRWKTWRPVSQPPGSPLYFIGEERTLALDGMIDLLITAMQRHFLAVQRIDLPILVRPAVVETPPYTLLFATRSKDSLVRMNDAVCAYRQRLNEQSHRGVLGEEWFATQQRERSSEEMQQLYQRTLQMGQSHRIRRWPDLRQQLLLANFGHFTLHDYDEMIHKLLLNGVIRCEWRRRSTESAYQENEEGRIPGNDDTLLWQ